MARQKLVWRKASCPICGEGFDYIHAPKPKTCGSFECIREAKIRDQKAKEAL